MSTKALQMLYITSCTDPLMWYADRVGQFAPLMRRLPVGDWWSQEPDGHSNIVRKFDAEEVTVFVPRPKLGQWPYIEPAHKLLYITPKDVVDRVRACAPPEPPAATPAQSACKDRCDMLGVCRGLPNCEEALGTARADKLASKAQAGQSRRLSAIEAATNIVVGFVVSVWITALLLPAFGHHVTLGQNLAMTSIFTVASFVRAYGLRRFFVWIDK